MLRLAEQFKIHFVIVTRGLKSPLRSLASLYALPGFSNTSRHLRQNVIENPKGGDRDRNALKKGDRHLAAVLFPQSLDCCSEPVPVFQRAARSPLAGYEHAMVSDAL